MRVSCGKHLFAPQLCEQGRRWQAQDREMVAFDLLEQMNSGPLQLVSADAGSYGRARLIKISVEKAFRKLAHGKPCDCHVAERDRPIPAYRHTRMQLMGFAAQRPKLSTGRGLIGRLGEAPFAKRQGLVAADHN